MSTTATEALTRAAETARLAPSIHNTQPWRWVVRGDRLELFAVAARQLREQDPDGRPMRLSCGAALHHARVALDAAQRADGRLHLLGRDQVLQLAVMIEHAGRAEQHDERMRAETATWVGGDRPEGTGLPDAVIPAEPPLTTVAERDFGVHGTLRAGTGHDSSADYAVLYGDGDDPVDWLRAGEALNEVWLAATDHGATVLPLSSPVELEFTRQALRRMLADVGYPYLVLRLGTSDPEHGGPSHTPRLPSDQIIEIAD